MGIKFTRGVKGQAPHVRELFPTFSGGRRNTRQATYRERIPAEDAEPRATNCYQCGQPIEAIEHDDCPFCQSTNTSGRRYYRRA